MLIYFENKPKPKLIRKSSSFKILVENRPTLAMDPPLSAYWVKFFKNAGFPSDVATRYALVFSNNRIKPDMLPDLDKPSLKEMGINLMGDMIAILRYAKKVVEETTCKKFLGNSEDSPPSKIASKPMVKKIVTTKLPPKTSIKSKEAPQLIKTVSSSVNKPLVLKKKVGSINQTSRMYSDQMDRPSKPKTIIMKRKYDSEDDQEDSEEDCGKWVHNESPKRLKGSDDIKYNVIMPKGTTVRSQKILKKALEQKRTVFHRLGDSMVSSTTNIESSHSNFKPTFNVTGVDSIKRGSSVFNRLGNKDEERLSRNGGISSRSQGILKTRAPMAGTKVLTTKPVLKKPVGTMRADEELSRKAVSSTIRQLVRPVKNLSFGEKPTRPIRRELSSTGKLASERMEMPAKSRLGASKQVTFKRATTVGHLRKPGVFSRLGV